MPLVYCYVFIQIYILSVPFKKQKAASKGISLFNPPIKNFEISWAEIATGKKTIQ